MTERTLAELTDAEIVPNMGGPNGWLVRFGEGDYDTVNKSAKNRLILEEKVGIQDAVEYGDILVHFDLEDDTITLTGKRGDVRVPSAKHENVLWAVHDDDGDRVQALFDELYTPTVRVGLMDQFMPRFRENQEDIRKTGDGWVVGDILVTWEASNHPVDDVNTHVVRGGEAVAADTEKQAREVNFDSAGDTKARTPDGRNIALDAVEVRFLTTVGLILGKNPDYGDDGVEQAIEASTIVGFTDTKSGLHHAHGLSKHTLSDLGVTEEAASRLWYNDYDHTGVHELWMRREEFTGAPIDVFTDAANDDQSKWQKINYTSEQAPIPKDVRADLEERYGE